MNPDLSELQRDNLLLKEQIRVADIAFQSLFERHQKLEAELKHVAADRDAWESTAKLPPSSIPCGHPDAQTYDGKGDGTWSHPVCRICELETKLKQCEKDRDEYWQVITNYHENPNWLKHWTKGRDHSFPEFVDNIINDRESLRAKEQDLFALLRRYLSMPSSDGRPDRANLRAQLRNLAGW